MSASHHYKLIPSCIITTLIILTTADARAGNEFVIKGAIRGCHDPSRIIAAEDRYWIFSTADNINLRSSADLINWRWEARPFSYSRGVPEWMEPYLAGTEANGPWNLWAPDIIKSKDKYLLFFSRNCGKNEQAYSVCGVAVSNSIANAQWIDQGPVLKVDFPSKPWRVIDPAPIFDVGGRLWLTVGSFGSPDAGGFRDGGIRIFELNPDTGKLKQPNDQGIRIAGSWIEASYIHYRSKWYYLFFNEGRCCRGKDSSYFIRVGRSRNITGPYVDRKGRDLRNGGGDLFMWFDYTHNKSTPPQPGSNGLLGREIGPGHVGIFTVPDSKTDVLSYHYYDGNTPNGEPTLGLRAIKWDADQWPHPETVSTSPAINQEMIAQKHEANLDKLLAAMQQAIDQGPYQPADESLAAYSVPEWYADAKFGIFIHYGLFSVPGYSGVGCWYGNKMYDPGHGAFKFHRENFGPQDRFGYKDFAPHLTASQFDADQWIGLFKQSGARFVVPVSCFHDGFAMWNSTLTDWNAVKTGPRRDYDGLLAAAARKQGLKFGVAWHAFFRPDFFQTGRRDGTDVRPPHAGTPWSFYGPAGGKPLSRDFIDDSLGRLVELVDGYQPDLIWFDFDTYLVPREDLLRFMTFYFNRATQWRKGVVINDKHEGLFPRSIVLDFERGKTLGLRSDLWQTDTSASWRDWSYIKDDSFKTTDYLVRELVDIVSKNGVLLLNIGPRPDGGIPSDPQRLLRGIGAWLKINGEAIYGTRPCWALGFGEGPHNSGGGGFSDAAIAYNAQDFRFTQKDNVVYAIAMEWPDVDHFLIRSLSDRSNFATGGISDVRLLGANEPLDWKLTPEGLWIRRPAHRPCDCAFAFKIVMQGIGVDKIHAERINDQQIQIDLRVRNFNARGGEQEIALFDNQQPIGRIIVSLGPSETVSRSVLLKAPLTKAVEIITASTPGAKPFVLRDEVVNPPTPGEAWKCDGKSMLAAAGLGKFDKLTISLWTRTDNLREPYTALLNTRGWDEGGLHVQYLRNGHLQVSLKTSGGVSESQSTSEPGLARGWRMITVTYDAAARLAEFYVNSELHGQVKVDRDSPVNLDAFTLGGWTGGERRFHGQMADVRIYDRILSPPEIRAVMESRASTNGLAAAWNFTPSDTGVVPDASRHGHDASFVK